MSDARWGGIARANFWRTQDFANLKRARMAHFVLNQRNWPESYLRECMADLSDQLLAKQRKRTRVSKPK
jgi:hypothetical protein